MARGTLQRRLRPIQARLLVDPRLGTWSDAVWLGEVFGLDPLAIITEERRLLQLCDAAGVSTDEEQTALVYEHSRLRPQVSNAEAERRMAAHPHYLAEVYWATDPVTGKVGDA